MVLHNGGLITNNFWAWQYAGDYRFLNLFKNSQEWIRVDNTTRYDPTKHDSDGYMHTVYGIGVYTLFKIPSQAKRPGNYVCTWDGGGTVDSTWITILSGSTTSGRFVCEQNATGIAQDGMQLRVTAVTTPGSNYPKNIRFFHEDDEARLDAGEMFGVKFMEIMNEMKPRDLRFLDDQNGNASNAIHWADRMPITHYSYAAQSNYPLNRYAGLTTKGVGDDYTVAKTGFTLIDQSQVIVKFDASSAGITPTIDIEVTGVKPIRNQIAALLATSQKPTANYLACLTWNARLGCYIKHGGDATRGDMGISGGGPPEIMIRMAREVGANPWFVSPYMAMDPLSDYMTSLAQLCEDTLNA